MRQILSQSYIAIMEKTTYSTTESLPYLAHSRNFKFHLKEALKKLNSKLYVPIQYRKTILVFLNYISSVTEDPTKLKQLLPLRLQLESTKTNLTLVEKKYIIDSCDFLVYHSKPFMRKNTSTNSMKKKCSKLLIFFKVFL